MSTSGVAVEFLLREYKHQQINYSPYSRSPGLIWRSPSEFTVSVEYLSFFFFVTTWYSFPTFSGPQTRQLGWGKQNSHVNPQLRWVQGSVIRMRTTNDRERSRCVEGQTIHRLGSLRWLQGANTYNVVLKNWSKQKRVWKWGAPEFVNSLLYRKSARNTSR